MQLLSVCQQKHLLLMSLMIVSTVTIACCGTCGAGDMQGVPSQQLLNELAVRGDPEAVMATAINVSSLLPLGTVRCSACADTLLFTLQSLTARAGVMLAPQG